MSEEILTFSECVIGYRSWRIDALGDLRALTADHVVWRRGVNTATCEAHLLTSRSQFVVSLMAGENDAPAQVAHDAPDARCECGFYAQHRLSDTIDGSFAGQVRAVNYPGDDELGDGIPIVGAVAAFGRLQVHRTGFRAEHAGVVALALPDGAGPRARARAAQVADTYGVRLVPLDELEQEASHHGTPLPESALPDPQPDDQLDIYSQVAATYGIPYPAPGTWVTLTSPAPPQLQAITHTFTFATGPEQKQRRVPALWLVSANAVVAGWNAGAWLFQGHGPLNAAGFGISAGCGAALALLRRRKGTAASGGGTDG